MLKLSALLLLVAAIFGLICVFVTSVGGIGLLPLMLAIAIFGLFLKELGH